MKNNQKGFVIPILIIIIALIAIGSGVYVYLDKSSNPQITNQDEDIVPVATTTDSSTDNIQVTPPQTSLPPNEPVFCTMDAMLCPDGTYVGRTGPSCVFVCPEIINVEKDLINNFCKVDDDCQYIWYTGGCNTPEYVAQKQKETKEKGMSMEEAPERENVTCTCNNNKCVTHN
jgi:hypothetical protein